LFQVFVALIISASFNPSVTRIVRLKIPRSLAVVIVYFIFLGIIGFSLYILIPTLIDQSTNFVKNLPVYLAGLGLPDVVRDRILSELLLQVGTIPSQIAKAVVSIFSNVLNFVAVLIFSFYFLVYRNKLISNLREFEGLKNKKNIIYAIENIEHKIGNWARGELALMFIVGTATYIGLLMMSVPYALPLGILAGLFEMVPLIGPFIAGAPAVLIGFGTSPVTGVAVAALAFLIQQVENYFLVPKIMQKSVGLNPIVTLLTLTVGFRLFGIIGALIAIPIVLTIQVIVVEYISFKDKE